MPWRQSAGHFAAGAYRSRFRPLAPQRIAAPQRRGSNDAAHGSRLAQARRVCGRHGLPFRATTACSRQGMESSRFHRRTCQRYSRSNWEAPLARLRSEGNRNPEPAPGTWANLRWRAHFAPLAERYAGEPQARLLLSGRSATHLCRSLKFCLSCSSAKPSAKIRSTFSRVKRAGCPPCEARRFPRHKRPMAVSTGSIGGAARRARRETALCREPPASATD